MAPAENPKKLAQDVADGLFTFNSGNLRRYTEPDLKQIMDHLNQLQNDIRQDIVPMDSPEYNDHIKEKNRRMGRIRNAATVIRSFAHRRSMKSIAS